MTLPSECEPFAFLLHSGGSSNRSRSTRGGTRGRPTKGAAAHGQGGRQRHNGQRSFLFRRALYDTRALGPLGHSRPGAVSGLINIT